MPTRAPVARRRSARFRGIPGAIALLLATVVAAAGCSSSPGINVKNPFGGAAGMKTIRIEITNLNWADATVYAFRGGERHRLGSVTGKTDQVFTMDWIQSYDLHFEIDLLAGGSCTTDTLNVSPGEIVELRIPIAMDRRGYCRGV